MKNMFGLILPALAALLLAAPQSHAATQAKSAGTQEWTLVNPLGVEHVSKTDVVPHDMDLNGKTIVLRWNTKPNGDIFLSRIAERLEKDFPAAKVVKAWEVNPKTNAGGVERAVFGGTEGIADSVAALNPDIVIASQAD